MARSRLGTRRVLHFKEISSGADLMSGSDGALSLNGTTAYIDAGNIKRYSSISIINNGKLVVRGYSVYQATNPGYLPTLIGCQNNCTINTGGQIIAIDNAGDDLSFYGDATYSAPVIPSDCAVPSISYTRYGSFGGNGGETGGFGTNAGYDEVWPPYFNPTGHGGGGAGFTDGGITQNDYAWGSSGAGAASGNQPAVDGLYPNISGFGASGTAGLGGEVATGDSVGGGGAGGLRGISGGCVYLQIGGVASVAASSIDLRGSPGGNGGAGGLGYTLAGTAIGGGGGGAGAGGSGGTGIIRYKSGTVSGSAVLYTGAAGGIGGAGGPDLTLMGQDGYPGQDGNMGSDGGSDIAVY